MSFIKISVIARWFFPLVFLLLVSACNNRPSYVLSENKMVNLMVDMQLAEAYVNNNPGGNTSETKKELGREVLALHNVSPEELDTTLAWYGRNLDQYSELFEKVDKEILKRKGYYLGEDVMSISDSDNLWPYSEHLVLSPLSGSDNFIISLNDPAIEKGGVVSLSFFLPNTTSVKGVLGVEYSDGTSEATMSTTNGRSKVEFKVQTDSGKIVSRLYGVMNLKEKKDNPVYIDSIFVTTVPFDSLEYLHNKRTQKKYGAILPHIKPVAPKDSTDQNKESRDSIQQQSEAIDNTQLVKSEENNSGSSKRKRTVTQLKRAS